MKDQFCIIIVFSVLLMPTNEQCPLSVGNSAITSCEASGKYGSNIYIDFNAIGSPCTCTALPSFDGQLLITSEDIVNVCGTEIYVKNAKDTFIFGCPISLYDSNFLNVQINQSVDIRAQYALPSSSGTFNHCLRFQQNGGLNGNLSVICGSPTEAATTTVSSTVSTTTFNSTQLSHATTPTEPSIETTSSSVVNTIENTDATLSPSTINVSYDSLSKESTKDDPEMLYIIAGSAGGGVIILVGLMVLILVLLNRTRGVRNKKGSTEADMARTNEVFDNNSELPDNPLYLSSQPMDELGYSSDQEKQLGLPPTDSKTKKKINSNYDVPPNNKPIDHGAPSMPVYAVPKRSNDRTPEVSTGNVYAEVRVRKSNEDGLLYMEVEQDTAATKQTNTNDKNEITEGVCYAEIKRT